MEGQRPLSPIANLSPVQIFVGGLVVGILVLCTIGFFILLPIVLKGGIVAADSANTYVADNVGANPTPSGQQPSAQIQLASVDEKTDHIRGAKKAKVTIVEYSDFQCPYCGSFHPTIQKILANYSDKVRVVYRHYPLSFHPEAMPAAEAAECAGDQGKFWEFHDQLFENQSRLSADYYKELAATLKLNVTAFNKCMTDHKYTQKIQSQMSGGNAAGVQGTPHSIAVGPNGQMVPISGAQPYEVVEATVKQLLNS